MRSYEFADRCGCGSLPNTAVVAPREARNLGMERDLMQLVVVPQGVRTDGASPP
jgi:hypothetical protein